jgi:DMSO/TMAO reductase YedYZ molybdopterin-dependent catalytic subunit
MRNLVKEAAMMITRRNLLLGGAAASLTGCTLLDGLTGDSALRALLQQAEHLTMASQRLLMGDALAPEFTLADIRQGQHPNGSTAVDSAEYLGLQQGGFAGYALEVGGLVERPLRLPYRDLTALPARTQITRHDCVEGWSCIAQWTGVPLSLILDQARPLLNARYVVFHCFDAIERGLAGEVLYYESIDMVDARHPQTILAWGLNGQPLPMANGAPLRLRVERQLGYKMAKFIRRIEVVDSLAGLGSGRGSYWADRGYEWYAGI